jgi:hypothetical protein
MASDSLANLGFHFNFQNSTVKVKKLLHPKTSPVKFKKPWLPKKKKFSAHRTNPKQSKNIPNRPNKANHAPPKKAHSKKIPNSKKKVSLENHASNLLISLDLHKNLEAPLPVDILKDMKAELHLHGLQLQEDSLEAMIHPAFQGNVTMPDLPEAPKTLIQASKG